MQLNPRFMLKLMYRSMSLFLPPLIYNPMATNKIYIPITLKQHSTYLNYKLNHDQISNLNNYIKSYNKSLKMVPIPLYENSNAHYYLSVNIYNSTSPIFRTDKDVIRCELNTYVIDEYGCKGTVILDYATNGPSMDPINGFKKNEFSLDLTFRECGDKIFNILCKSNRADIYLNLNFTQSSVFPKPLSHDLIEFTDKIYYKNGIFDKLYYDNSLLNPVLMGANIEHQTFIYRNMEFEQLESIFFFKDSLHFVGSMWDNLME